MKCFFFVTWFRYLASYFQDDYKDDISSNPEVGQKSKIDEKGDISASELIDVTDSRFDQLGLVSSSMITDTQVPSSTNNSASTDLLKMMNESDFGDFVSSSPYMPSQLLINDLENFSFDNLKLESSATPNLIESSAENITKKKNSILELFNRTPNNMTSPCTSNEMDSARRSSPQQSKDKSRKDKSAWFELFADLDPLANPESLEKKLGGNSQAA